MNKEKKKTKRDKERWGSGRLSLILSAVSIPGGPLAEAVNRRTLTVSTTTKMVYGCCYWMKI